jgi:hypothetical protein
MGEFVCNNKEILGSLKAKCKHNIRPLSVYVYLSK